MTDVETFIRVVDWLKANPDLAAIAIGLLNSMGMTQFIKFQLLQFRIDYRNWTRLVAFFIGLFTVLSIWVVAVEQHWIWGLQYGMIVGSLSPFIYKGLTFIIYRIFPGMEKYLSAEPRIQIKQDGEGNVGYKVGDDPTVYPNSKGTNDE